VPKLILHSSANLDAIEQRRLNENLLLSPIQRIEKMFLLIETARAFSKNPLKQPQGKGLVLRVKYDLTQYVKVNVVHINTLIREKEQSIRAKDREDTEQLKKIRNK
jgi:hypothetical protein